MEERTLTYFVSDVHLGLRKPDPVEREERFLRFLRSIPRKKLKALYLLGDIWDFWYEYRDVIPSEGVRVLSELIQMVSEGVEVVFIPGNHDMWCYRLFDNLGIRKVEQPYFPEIDGKKLCVGHGDALGGADKSYLLMLWMFRNRVVRRLFNLFHPLLAFHLGRSMSKKSRNSHHSGYRFRGKDEPLYKFARATAAERPVDLFIFGHFHDLVDMEVEGGSRLIVLKDWIGGGVHYAVMENGEVSVF